MIDVIVSFFRDTISGTYYVIYAIILLTLLFAIVGYMFKQKYAKVEFKVSGGTSKGKPTREKKAKEKKPKTKKGLTSTNDKVLAASGLASQDKNANQPLNVPPKTTLAASNAPLPPLTGAKANIPDVANQSK